MPLSFRHPPVANTTALTRACRTCSRYDWSPFTAVLEYPNWSTSQAISCEIFHRMMIDNCMPHRITVRCATSSACTTFWVVPHRHLSFSYKYSAYSESVVPFPPVHLHGICRLFLRLTGRFRFVDVLWKSFNRSEQKSYASQNTKRQKNTTQ